MTLHEKQRHFSQMFVRLFSEAERRGLEPVIDMVARTPQEQARLVRIGASQTLKSKHVERLAGDLLLFRHGVYLITPADYAALGAWWKAQDAVNRWGGDWNWDGNHFEYNG